MPQRNEPEAWKRAWTRKAARRLCALLGAQGTAARRADPLELERVCRTPGFEVANSVRGTCPRDVVITAGPHRPELGAAVRRDQRPRLLASCRSDPHDAALVAALVRRADRPWKMRPTSTDASARKMASCAGVLQVGRREK